MKTQLSISCYLITMMDNKNKYSIQDLDEYIRQGVPKRREKAIAWQTAIGLQAVDGLTVSSYLIELAIKNIKGELTSQEVVMSITLPNIRNTVLIQESIMFQTR